MRRSLRQPTRRALRWRLPACVTSGIEKARNPPRPVRIVPPNSYGALAALRASDKELRLGRLWAGEAWWSVTRKHAFAFDGFERTQW
jgi:hypothetical protein